jgi:hypothetical protein
MIFKTYAKKVIVSTMKLKSLRKWIRMMELRGIEPLSESPSIAISPITVYLLCVPVHAVPSVERQ